MTQTASLRRRRDGSIDTEHYMDRAHQLRSTEATAMASAASRALLRLVCGQLRRMRANLSIGMPQKP